jgi:indole-3-glycerol phosphate synthase
VATILDQIVEQKKQEIETARSIVPLEMLLDRVQSQDPARDFCAALNAAAGVGLIAEVKKASPSQGVLREDFDPVAIARIYAAAGAHCVSVLTDTHFFQGQLDYLSQIRQAIKIPVLRKDFVIDSYQVLEARAAGADAVLLIAECLDAGKLQDLHDEIVAAGMAPLIEFYEPENLEKVLATQTRLIGINNRNLHSFETDLMHCIRLRQQIPDDRIVVGESGIRSSADVQQLATAGIDAMLVGESLMKSHDMGTAVQQLLGLTV